MIPCVSHGRADAAAGFGAAAADDAKGGADAAADVPNPNLIGAAPPLADPPELPPNPTWIAPPLSFASPPVGAFGFLVSHEIHLTTPSSLITRHTAHRHSLSSGSSLGGLKVRRFCAVSSSSELPMSASESSEPTSDSFSSTKSSCAALFEGDAAALVGVLLLMTQFCGVGLFLETVVLLVPLRFCKSAMKPTIPP